MMSHNLRKLYDICFFFIGLLDNVTVLIGIAYEGKAIAGVINQPYYNYQVFLESIQRYFIRQLYCHTIPDVNPVVSGLVARAAIFSKYRFPGHAPDLLSQKL